MDTNKTRPRWNSPRAAFTWRWRGAQISKATDRSVDSCRTTIHESFRSLGNFSAARSADFQSAVSQGFQPAVRGRPTAFDRADPVPIGNRRYSRLEICATLAASLPLRAFALKSKELMEWFRLRPDDSVQRRMDLARHGCPIQRFNGPTIQHPLWLRLCLSRPFVRLSR